MRVARQLGSVSWYHKLSRQRANHSRSSETPADILHAVRCGNRTSTQSRTKNKRVHWALFDWSGKNGLSDFISSDFCPRRHRQLWALIGLTAADFAVQPSPEFTATMEHEQFPLSWQRNAEHIIGDVCRNCRWKIWNTLLRQRTLLTVMTKCISVQYTCSWCTGRSVYQIPVCSRT